MSTSDSVTVTTVVATDPDRAFALFTGEIGEWWHPKVRNLFRTGPPGVMTFEPGPAGRLLEVYPGDAQPPFEVGRVLVWDPPGRLVFEWRQGSFAAGEVTEVEVRFKPTRRGTRVTLEHRGWDSLPPDHPARHAYTGEAFTSMIGLRWADLLTAMRWHARAA
jgi:hypothetical protein